MSAEGFYMLPRFLFTGSFSGLSNDARVLYTLLRNRYRISVRNGWKDAKGKHFIYFKRSEIQKELWLSKNTVSKAVDEMKRAGLVAEERQGRNLPNRIYLLYEEQLLCALGGSNITPPEAQNTPLLNNNNISYKENTSNNQDLSGARQGTADKTENCFLNDSEKIEAYEATLKQNIEYETFLRPEDKSFAEELIAVMLDTFMGKSRYVRVNGEEMGRALVKSRLMKLNREHVLYVMERFRRTPEHVTKRKQYLLSMLYNASMEMEAYYAQR